MKAVTALALLFSSFCGDVFGQSSLSKALWLNCSQKKIQWRLGGGPAVITTSRTFFPTSLKFEKEKVNHFPNLIEQHSDWLFGEKGYVHGVALLKGVARIQSPIGLTVQGSGTYQILPWLGVCLTGEVAAYDQYAESYRYSTASFGTMVDPNSPPGGPYTYFYNSTPPDSRVGLHQLILSESLKLQLQVQTPGGRIGIRSGLEVHSYQFPGVRTFSRSVLGGRSGSGDFQTMAVNTLFVGLTPRTRIEVQNAFVHYIYPIREFGATIIPDSPTVAWLLSFQYQLN